MKKTTKPAAKKMSKGGSTNGNQNFQPKPLAKKGGMK